MRETKGKTFRVKSVCANLKSAIKAILIKSIATGEKRLLLEKMQADLFKTIDSFELISPQAERTHLSNCLVKTGASTENKNNSSYVQNKSVSQRSDAANGR